MFIIFFAIFVFIFTVRENISLGVIMLWIIFLGIICYRRIAHKKVKRYFLFILLAFTLSLWSFLRNTYSSPSNIHQSKSFIWTGIIQDVSTAWKYIFTTSTASYVLQSKQEHQIGEELFLVGRRSSWVYSWSQEDQSFLAFDYVKWLKMKWLQWLIYETNSSVIHTNQAWRISQTKKSLQQKVISLYGKNKVSWLILGMLIGDRSLIPSDDYKWFINSGLVHLIAVSWWNLVMITIFLWLVLFFLPFYIRSGVILLAIIFYALLCGLDSSVFRAVITWWLSLLALFRGKEIPIWRLLSMAFIAMLIINPYYLVYDVGFLMSFAAVIGIILLERWLAPQTHPKPLPWQGGEVSKPQKQNFYLKPLLYIWKNYLQPSVGATMGVFPIIIFFMWQLNLLSIIGNLFVLPLVPFVMIYGFISIFLFQLLQRHWILSIEKVFILYIYKVSELSSSFGLFLSMSGWVKRMVLLGFLTWFIWQRMNKKKEKDMDAGKSLSRPGLPGLHLPLSRETSLYPLDKGGGEAGGFVKKNFEINIKSSF